MPESRMATQGDILQFFEKLPPQTIRARVLERDGEVVGVAGYFVTGGMAVMFSDKRADIPKMTIWREAVAMMKGMKIPAVCVAESGSGPFLERLGWKRAGTSADGDVYTWRC